LRHGTGRGDRDEHDGGLTLGGGRWQQPDFAGQRRRPGFGGGGSVCAQGGGASGTAGRRQAVQGRATRAARKGVAPFIGTRTGSRRLGLPTEAAAPCAAGGRAQMGLAGLAGRAQAGWVEPRARPNPVDRFCFFSFFSEIYFQYKRIPEKLQ
jgi:hypothetical protein